MQLTLDRSQVDEAIENYVAAMFGTTPENVFVIRVVRERGTGGAHADVSIDLPVNDSDTEE
jgi:hypothetical protein